MNVHQRLKALSHRKQHRQELIADVRAGRFEGIESATTFFARREHEPPATECLLDALPGAEIHEGPTGRTIIRAMRFRPGEATGRYGITEWPGQPTTPPFQTGAFGLLAQDFQKEKAAIGPESVCFLDTETTGLAGGTGTVAFLVGLGWWENAPEGWSYVLEQYLIEDFCHEGDMLHRLVERLAQFTVVCTYNGKAFDMPLLRARAILHRIPPRKFQHRHLDLLHFSRRIWGQALKSVSLKNMEKFVLGFDRGDDIDGALIPSIFLHTARTGRPGQMPTVLDHNAWDIISLSALLHRQIEVAENPLGCGHLMHPGEFAGVARWLESRLIYAEARHAWTRALEACRNPEEEESLMVRAALCCKRLRAWGEAVSYWETLGRRSHLRHAAAWIEKAKYLEHVARNPRAALAVVEECRRQIELEADLARVVGKPSAIPDSALSVLSDLRRRATRLRRRLKRATPRAGRK